MYRALFNECRCIYLYIVSNHEPCAKKSDKLTSGSAARNSSTLCTTGFGLGMTCKLKSWRRLGASFLLIPSIWKSPMQTQQATRGGQNEADESIPAEECLPEERKMPSPEGKHAQLCQWDPGPFLGDPALSSQMSAAEKLALERLLPDGRSPGTSRPSPSPPSPCISARDMDRGRRTGSSGLGLGGLIPVVSVVSQALPLGPPMLDSICLLLGLHVRKATTLGKGFATNDNTVSQAEGDALLGATACPRMKSQAKKSCKQEHA